MAVLSLVFGLELAVITVLLDGASLKQPDGLTAAVRDWGPLILRGIVGFLAFFAAFSWLQRKSRLESVWETAGNWPLRPFPALAHVVAMAVFGFLSAGLYAGLLPGFAPDLLAVGWMAAGLLGIAGGALAVLPWSVWSATFRATGYAWLYSLAAVVGALAAQQASRGLWNAAARVTFALVRVILRPFVTVIMADPVAMRIQTPHFRVIIAAECSGLEGAGLMLAFGIVFLWLFRKEFRFPQSLLLIPGGIVLLFLLNAVRIAALVLIGDAGAQQIAVGGFHSQAGWIAFNSVAFGLAISARRLSWFSTRIAAAEEPAKTRQDSTAAYLMPFLLVLAAGMLSRAMSGGFEWFYGLRFLAAAGGLWYFRRFYARLSWKFGWSAVGTATLAALLWVTPDLLGHQWGTVGMPAALAGASPPLRLIWIVIRTGTAVVTVPLTEELAFRGYLLRRLSAADFEAVSFGRIPTQIPWMALLGSSLIFGILHGGRWVTGSIAGLLYGLIYVRRGRLADSVAAHALTNAMLTGAVLWFDQWQFW